MTDKEQIIVDGVNVKNCKGIDLSLSPLVKCKSLKFKTSDGGIAGIWCSDHTNCYFKQLARKTHECEKYKKRAVCFKDVNKQLGYKYLTIKQECEELKKEIINKNEKIKELRFSVSDLTNRLCSLNAEKSFRIVDLEQTLDEIVNYINSQGIDNKWNMYIQRFRSGILNIINKAKGRWECQ